MTRKVMTPLPIPGPAGNQEVIMNKHNEKSTPSDANKSPAPASAPTPAPAKFEAGHKPDAAPVKAPANQPNSPNSPISPNAPVAAIKEPAASVHTDPKPGHDGNKPAAQAPAKS